MPVELVVKCAKCGALVEADPELAHMQGQEVLIVTAAMVGQLKLCANCFARLFHEFISHVEQVIPGGTVTGAAKIDFLPMDSEEPPPGSGGSVQVATLATPQGGGAATPARSPRRSSGRSARPRPS